MTTRRFAQIALTTCFLGASAAFVFAACAAIASAQNLNARSWSGKAVPVPYVLAQNASGSLTLPEAPETPVSPATPGTLPGTTAGGGVSTGTNPITGQPCGGAGSTALSGGIPGGSEEGEVPLPDSTPGGLPPASSVFGANNGAC